MEKVGLSTPLIADGCVRLGIPVRVAPGGIRSIIPGQRLAGRVCPARHAGSVDVFFEAALRAAPGDVLVVDNGGRDDEGCVGDLVALEAQAHHLAGIVIWGAHRDTTDLAQIRLPVFSYGSNPAGPAGVRRRTKDALQAARFGTHRVSAEDAVFADIDGVLFVPMARLAEVIDVARMIARAERAHAQKARAGVSLGKQFQFADYLKRAKKDPKYTLREHLRRLGAAIEE